MLVSLVSVASLRGLNERWAVKPTCRDRVGWVITCGAGAASYGLDGSGAFPLGPSGFHLPAACRRLTPLVDIRAITAYCEDIAPDPGSCTLEIQGTVQDRSFLIRVGAVKALRPSKGQEPAGANFSHRDLSRRTGYPYVTFLTDQGVGWLATKLFHIHTLHGFFNLSTWVTAIIGAAILLLAYHLVTSRERSRSHTRSRYRTRGRRRARV